MKNSVKKFVTTTILLFSILVLANTQTITGKWFSLLKVQGIELEININLTEVNGTLAGTFEVPAQGAIDIPLTSVSLSDLEFAFSFVPAGFSFSGITDPGYNQIIGYFKQGDINELMKFTRTPGEKSASSQSKIFEIYDKKEVYIEMRDGIKLFTSIYSPKESKEDSPMLLFRSPYNSEPGGENSMNFFVTAYYRYIKEGYILVFQDVRGRYMSEGDFVNVRPFIPNKSGLQIDEASDTYDTAEWLVNNVANNNGNIGVMGVSYPGFYSTMAILAKHPAIKAVSPQAPVTNWFIGDDWHHNGAFFLIDGTSFYNNFGDPQDNPTRLNSPANFIYGMSDNYEFYLKMGPLKNSRKLFPEKVTYWQELMAHPNYDDWWKATVPTPHLKEVQTAVMTVGGWFDAEDLYGALHTYKAIEDQNSKSTSNFIVMGPWSHGQWATGEAKNMGDIYWGVESNSHFHKLEMDFFNHYLKSEGGDKIPESTIFITGENKWSQFETWPPENVTEKTLFFSSTGTLSFEASQQKSSYVEYLSDPSKPVPYREDVHLRRDPSYMTDDQRFASRRPDVVVYQTIPLEEDVTLTGELTADLWVSMTGTDADFIVKLIDVYPDNATPIEGQEINMPLAGFQMLVRGEVMRGKYRNSFEKPEAFTPNKVTQVKYAIPDVAHTFKKGHKIMVQVQSTWFPLIDRNPQKFVNIYECDESDFQKSTIRIYSDSNYRSGLKVKVLNK